MNESNYILNSIRNHTVTIRRSADDRAGFTLVELIVVAAILGILISVVTPLMYSALQAARVAACKADIRTIEKAVATVVAEMNALPASLNDINLGTQLDPWHRPFEYSTTPLIEDDALNKLNTDYDLYSKGADGASDPAGGNPVNLDDIVRAHEGSYVGER